MKTKPFLLCLVLLLWVPAVSHAGDPRELVAMPDEVRQRLLDGMLNHMTVFNSILSLIANERFEQAARLAEEHLPIGPLDSQAEENAAAYFPPAMQDARESLREAGKRLAVAVRKANTEHSYFRMRKVTATIGEVQAACNMCHAHYRIR